MDNEEKKNNSFEDDGTKPVFRWEYEKQSEYDKKSKAFTTRQGRILLIVLVSFCIAATVAIAVLFIALDEFKRHDNRIYIDTGATVLDGNSKELKTIVENSNKFTVVVYSTSDKLASVGSGVIINESGFIVTNYHVIDGMSRTSVTLYGGETFRARVVGYSIEDDIAVLKIDPRGTKLTCAVFADNVNDLYKGQDVFAIGTTAGRDYSWSMTMGHISYVNRMVKMYDEEGNNNMLMRLIQTDTSLNPGNSGGPLISLDGRVIGIVNMKLDQEKYDGIGFAIPSDGVIPIVEEIIEKGTSKGINSTITVDRPMLGITGLAVEKGKYYNLGVDRVVETTETEYKRNPDKVFFAEEDGIWIKKTESDSKTKLKVNDIITRINDKSVLNVTDISDILNSLSVGDQVNIEYVRDGNIENVSVVLS